MTEFVIEYIEGLFFWYCFPLFDLVQQHGRRIHSVVYIAACEKLLSKLLKQNSCNCHCGTNVQRLCLEFHSQGLSQNVMSWRFLMKLKIVCIQLFLTKGILCISRSCIFDKILPNNRLAPHSWGLPSLENLGFVPDTSATPALFKALLSQQLNSNEK